MAQDIRDGLGIGDQIRAVGIADNRPGIADDLVGGAAALRQRQFFHVQHSAAQRILALRTVTRRIVALQPIGRYPGR